MNLWINYIKNLYNKNKLEMNFKNKRKWINKIQ